MEPLAWEAPFLKCGRGQGERNLVVMDTGGLWEAEEKSVVAGLRNERNFANICNRKRTKKWESPWNEHGPGVLGTSSRKFRSPNPPPPPPTSHHHHLGKRLGMYIKLLYAHFVIPYQVTDLKRHCHRVFAVLKSLLCTLTHTKCSAKLRER